MLKLSDISIKVKLYGLVALSTLGVALVLGLAAFLQATYRINGPIYGRIAVAREALSETEPAILCLTQPYITLQEMESARPGAELNALLTRYQEEKKTYHERRAHWLGKLPDGPYRQLLEGDVHRTAADMFRVADEEYVPVVSKSDAASRARASQLLRDRVMPRFRAQRDASFEAV